MKWFPKTNKNGEEFNGDKTEAALISFINEATGAQRVAGGGLTGLAGRVAIMDRLAAKFADESIREEVLAEASNVAAASGKNSNAAVYVSIMNKMIFNGNSYVMAEMNRIDRMSRSGNVKVL